MNAPTGAGVQNKPLRGEIWEIDLNPRKGREQKGRRPCVVVSTNSLNRSDFGTIIICPVTTRERPTFRWRPGLVPEDVRVEQADWRAKPCWIETDQIVTVDRTERAIRHLATITNPARMVEVDDSLRMLLSLRD